MEIVITIFFGTVAIMAALLFCFIVTIATVVFIGERMDRKEKEKKQ